jgi:hypothetical protein
MWALQSLHVMARWQHSLPLNAWHLDHALCGGVLLIRCWVRQQLATFHTVLNGGHHQLDVDELDA